MVENHILDFSPLGMIAADCVMNQLETNTTWIILVSYRTSSHVQREIILLQKPCRWIKRNNKKVQIDANSIFSFKHTDETIEVIRLQRASCVSYSWMTMH
ncbi:uncharacterized protein LOC122008152 isoform X2 [Zingiber officinale]|uniref:uncharacterized protein LOC122008152 isoform X2 n=1 Tax=Zingiber officinale TaxID=94328 RepID=UPI001C4A994B|nr:uncharacterized protein LOC122008152 isoform X2 [Zingiber officinale]